MCRILRDSQGRRALLAHIEIYGLPNRLPRLLALRRALARKRTAEKKQTETLSRFMQIKIYFV